MTELEIVALVMPTVLLVAIGWFTVRIHLFAVADAKVISALFLHVCAPALILAHLDKQDLSELYEPAFIFATLFLISSLYVGIFWFHAGFLKRPVGMSAVAAFAGTKFNAVVVGLPVLFATVGHKAIVAMTVNVVMGYFTILPLTLLLINYSKLSVGAKSQVREILLSSLLKALTNPLVVATLAGLLLAGRRVDLPGWVSETLLELGHGAIPAALIAVGMSLNAVSIRENAAEIVSMSAVRVLLSPALAFLVAKIFGLSPIFAIALVIAFSLPTAKMVLPLAEENKTYVCESAGIIALTTVSLVVVWPIVIWVCGQLWPGVIGGSG